MKIRPLIAIIAHFHGTKKWIFSLGTLLIFSGFARADDTAANHESQRATATAFRLVSDDIRDGTRLPDAQVFNGFGYHGGNLSPQLTWSGAPAGTKSFVITMFDPDAPTGHGWWHWAVIDVPASVSALPRGAGSGAASLPKGARELRNDFGKSNYGGAAPPAGKSHRYVFTIYALSVAKLSADEDSSAAQISKMLHGKILAKSSITAIYGKP